MPQFFIQNFSYGLEVVTKTQKLFLQKTPPSFCEDNLYFYLVMCCIAKDFP